MCRYILLPLFLLVSAGGFAQSDFCSAKNISFQENEKLTFRVFYALGKVFVPAGEAVFSISDDRYGGKEIYKITGEGKTLRSYDLFFKVRDRYESYIDKKTLSPLHFVRTVNEGGIHIFNDVTFRQQEGKAVSSEGKSYSIPKCTQDVLSAIYFARNIDFDKLKPGTKIPFNMFLDDKIYNVYIRYLGKEEVMTRYGKFKAIRIAPSLIEGSLFKGGEKMTIWISDDDNHLPLRIESPILVGSIKVDLTGYENLRNPLSSMIRRK